MPREKPCGAGLMLGGVWALERWGLANAAGLTVGKRVRLLTVPGFGQIAGFTGVTRS